MHSRAKLDKTLFTASSRTLLRETGFKKNKKSAGQ